MKNRRSYWHHLLEAHILPAFLPHIAEAFAGEPRDQFLREIDHLHLRTMADYAAAVFMLLQIDDRAKIEQTLRGTKFPVADMKLCLNLLGSPLLLLADTFSRIELKRALAQITPRDRVAHMRFATAMRASRQTTAGMLPGPVRHARQHASALYISIRRSREPLDISDLAVSGTDVQALGIQGRAVGDALEKLRATVIERPELNRRDELIGILKAMPSV
jgi:hypothetical protein